MNGGEFDGNAAFSGGGFMPSQATQSADPGLTPAKNRDIQTLLPLTVKQIHDAFQATDDKTEFQIDAVDVHNVKLVGMMFEKTERITDVAFVLDDGTGRIGCHRWVNEPHESKEVEMLQDGIYVKVHGNLKGIQGKKKLNVFSIRPVTDYNEITNHFAECIYVHCHNTRLRRQVPSHMSNVQKTQNAGQVPTHISNSAFDTPSKGYQSTPSNNFSVQYNMDGVPDNKQLVLNLLNQPACLGSDQGFHVKEVAQHLNISVQKISEIIAVLVDEGLAYPTIDDEHYKSTDG